MRDIHLCLQPRTQSLHACPEMSPQEPGGSPSTHPTSLPAPAHCPPPPSPPPWPHFHALRDRARNAADAAAQSFRGHALSASSDSLCRSSPVGSAHTACRDGTTKGASQLLSGTAASGSRVPGVGP